jgi:hypothetical protein
LLSPCKFAGAQFDMKTGDCYNYSFFTLKLSGDKAIHMPWSGGAEMEEMAKKWHQTGAVFQLVLILGASRKCNP